MACSEINQMRQEVCQSLRGSLDTWEHNLQSKWGDPRVYAEQQQERLRQDARVVYDLNRRNTELLSEAYARQSEKQRSAHSARMDNLRRRGYRNGGKRPGSAAASATRTPPPSAPPYVSPPEAPEHPTGADPEYSSTP